MKLYRFLGAVSAIGIVFFGLFGSNIEPPVSTDPFSPQEHFALLDTVKQAGVTVEVNGEICNRGFSGIYHSGKRLLVICQENQVDGDSRTVAWTEDDYDTIRHEVVHMIQDMVGGGRIGDLALAPYHEGESLRELISGALSDKEVDNIIYVYSTHGTRDADLILELEAFAAARVIAPGTLAATIRELSQ